MPKINVVNSDNVIECKPQKAFFKLTNTGGLKGDKGDKGDDATVSVGTTTTGAPGTNASVTNSGTSSAAVLDFTIPRGADGADGEAATVAVGTTTTLDAGSSATVTNSGTSSAAVLNFGIPKGADGQDGQDGAAATITVGSTTTGEPGTNASVTNSGTTSAAVLNFTIPRGATGATGQDGADGFSPSATVTSSNNDATISITDKDGTTTATVKGFGFEEVSTLPASGSSEKLYLTPHTYPTNTATGSSMSLNDSAAAPLKSVQIDGETIQTGKNIFNKNNVHAISAYVAAQAINSASDTTIFVVCKPSTTYTITKTASTPQTANRFRVATTSVVPAVGVAVSDFINPGDGTADTSVTITTGSSAQYLVVTVQTSSATSSLSSIYSTLQIEEGSSGTSYEPYIGGVPNPNYPVPVQTVTGENVVQICGKNLFDNDTATNTYIQNNGNITPNTAWRASQLIKVKPNTSYIWHGEVYGVRQVVWAGYNSSRAFISGQYAQVNNVDSLVIITGGNTEYIRVGYRSDGMRNMQLEVGNQATAYQAYTGQSYEVNLGKNLLNVSGLNATDNGVSNTLNSDGSITCSGTVGSSWNGWNLSGHMAIDLPAGTYTFSIDHTLTVGMSFVVRDSNNSNIASVSINAGSTSVTFTTTSDGKSAMLWASASTGTAINFTIKAQCELGSQASSFAPYFTPIELCKIGDYQDYIYPRGDKWYVRKEVGKYTFTSNETVSYQSNFPRFMVNFSHGQDATAGVVTLAKSTHFVVGQTASVDGTFGIAASVIYLHNNAITSADDLKTWFGNNNVSVYFALATPTDTEITNAALIAQLEALAAGTTYDGITNIAFTCVQGNDNGELEIEYYTQYDAMRLYDKFIWINKWEAL